MPHDNCTRPSTSIRLQPEPPSPGTDKEKKSIKPRPVPSVSPRTRLFCDKNPRAGPSVQSRPDPISPRRQKLVQRSESDNSCLQASREKYFWDKDPKRDICNKLEKQLSLNLQRKKYERQESGEAKRTSSSALEKKRNLGDHNVSRQLPSQKSQKVIRKSSGKIPDADKVFNQKELINPPSNILDVEKTQRNYINPDKNTEPTIPNVKTSKHHPKLLSPPIETNFPITGGITQTFKNFTAAFLKPDTSPKMETRQHPKLFVGDKKLSGASTSHGEPESIGNSSRVLFKAGNGSQNEMYSKPNSSEVVRESNRCQMRSCGQRKNDDCKTYIRPVPPTSIKQSNVNVHTQVYSKEKDLPKKSLFGSNFVSKFTSSSFTDIANTFIEGILGSHSFSANSSPQLNRNTKISRNLSSKEGNTTAYSKHLGVQDQSENCHPLKHPALQTEKEICDSSTSQKDPQKIRKRETIDRFKNHIYENVPINSKSAKSSDSTNVKVNDQSIHNERQIIKIVVEPDLKLETENETDDISLESCLKYSSLKRETKKDKNDGITFLGDDLPKLEIQDLTESPRREKVLRIQSDDFHDSDSETRSPRKLYSPPPPLLLEKDNLCQDMDLRFALATKINTVSPTASQHKTYQKCFVDEQPIYDKFSNINNGKNNKKSNKFSRTCDKIKNCSNSLRASNKKRMTKSSEYLKSDQKEMKNKVRKLSRDYSGGNLKSTLLSIGKPYYRFLSKSQTLPKKYDENVDDYEMSPKSTEKCKSLPLPRYKWSTKVSPEDFLGFEDVYPSAVADLENILDEYSSNDDEIDISSLFDVVDERNDNIVVGKDFAGNKIPAFCNSTTFKQNVLLNDGKSTRYYENKNELVKNNIDENGNPMVLINDSFLNIPHDFPCALNLNLLHKDNINLSENPFHFEPKPSSSFEGHKNFKINVDQEHSEAMDTDNCENENLNTEDTLHKKESNLFTYSINPNIKSNVSKSLFNEDIYMKNKVDDHNRNTEIENLNTYKENMINVNSFAEEPKVNIFNETYKNVKYNIGDGYEKYSPFDKNLNCKKRSGSIHAITSNKNSDIDKTFCLIGHKRVPLRKSASLPNSNDFSKYTNQNSSKLNVASDFNNTILSKKGILKFKNEPIPCSTSSLIDTCNSLHSSICSDSMHLEVIKENELIPSPTNNIASDNLMQVDDIEVNDKVLCSSSSMNEGNIKNRSSVPSSLCDDSMPLEILPENEQHECSMGKINKFSNSLNSSFCADNLPLDSIQENDVDDICAFDDNETDLSNIFDSVNKFKENNSTDSDNSSSSILSLEKLFMEYERPIDCIQPTLPINIKQSIHDYIKPLTNRLEMVDIGEKKINFDDNVSEQEVSCKSKPKVNFNFSAIQTTIIESSTDEEEEENSPLIKFEPPKFSAVELLAKTAPPRRNIVSSTSPKIQPKIKPAPTFNETLVKALESLISDTISDVVETQELLRENPLMNFETTTSDQDERMNQEIDQIHDKCKVDGKKIFKKEINIDVSNVISESPVLDNIGTPDYIQPTLDKESEKLDLNPCENITIEDTYQILPAGNIRLPSTSAEYPLLSISLPDASGLLSDENLKEEDLNVKMSESMCSGEWLIQNRRRKKKAPQLD